MKIEILQVEEILKVDILILQMKEILEVENLCKRRFKIAILQMEETLQVKTVQQALRKKNGSKLKTQKESNIDPKKSVKKYDLYRIKTVTKSFKHSNET
ncbi:hypothetical protein ANTQUA_LOCUS3571 [Anthophora quadrimaculata]